MPTPEEVDAILAAAAADDERLGRSLALPLLTLAFGTGLRLGELLGLVWGPEGLDLDAESVRVRRSVDRLRDVTGRFPLIAPKSRAALRDVPLAPADAAVLRRHLLASGRPAAGSLVFSDGRGEPLDAAGAVRHVWERVRDGAGIAEPAPRFHDARHAWAVAMPRAGVPPAALARLGGWSDVGMIHRRYGRHALPDELAGAGAALGPPARRAAGEPMTTVVTWWSHDRYSLRTPC